EQAGDRWIVSSKSLSDHRGSRHALVGEEHAEIFVDLRAAGESQGRAELVGLFLIGLATFSEAARDLPPSFAWEIRAIDDLAFDILDTIALADAKHACHLRRRGLSAAARIRPGHEMVTRETGLAHHVLEGDVGRVRHRRLQRTADGAV